MSLVGNLEDLSLGDIMQIISLSQKSGVLALEGESGSGRIVFLKGLVHAASVKGELEDLRGVLVGKGLLDATTYDGLADSATELGLPIEEAITREGKLSAEQIDDALKEAIEGVILQMFAWPSGDFSFDVRSELEPDDPQTLLSAGINAQYLAMEGMRISDEQSRDGAASGPPPVEANADDLFGSDPLETEPLEAVSLETDPFAAEAIVDGNEDTAEIVQAEVVAIELDEEVSAADVLVATVVSREDDHDATEAADAFVAEEDLETPAPEVESAEGAPSEQVAESIEAPEPAIEPEPVAAARSVGQAMSVVLIDPDVTSLEWIKSTIQDDFARVHVFQQAEQGLSRIRQYLIRGELPVVLISTDVRIDSLSGIHGLADFVARLKTQAKRLVVVGLHEEREAGEPSSSIAFDGILSKPQRAGLRSGDESRMAAAVALADGLQEILVGHASSASSRAAGRTNSGSLQDLRDTTRRLQDASSRGEILPVVLDFAAELFARVAILIVREDRVFAIAGRGIETLEVADPLDSSEPISLQNFESGWIRQVMDTRKPLHGPPETDADRDLLARLGGIEPGTVYVGPIESSGSTIALLYGDQSTSGVALPDTSGLEVVLQHAGLALDRAALERALWEADANES